MIEMEIPGFGEIRLKSLVMDYNGTLAVGGQLLPGVAERLQVLSSHLSLFVVTADTFGTAKDQLRNLPVEVVVLQGAESQTKAKRAFVRKLDAKQVAAIGNGRNDRLMLADARVGVTVILQEGASPQTLGVANIVVTEIGDALDLFLHPLRLKATLRG
ncbi:MAG: ATPase P [Acidobacteria bacterium]|nr:MAG: ATPase P [Acidobacteriota bacterium]